MKKIIFLIILGCVILLSFTGCKEQNELVKGKAQVIADAFTNNDMETINELIFGTSKISVDDELSDIWGENYESRDGVLTYIFDLVTVEVKEITDSTVEYKIKAPDMSKVFVDMNANADNLSEDELLDYIKSYAKNAETKDTTVFLEYILVEDELILNYQDDEFVNAVTGGLLDAYKTLYSEMLEEYTKGAD